MKQNTDDLISREDAINALWKALYEYEDKTEKQFQESDELDVGDWILHRIFVQNMSDIDRQTILDLPSAQQWIPCSKTLPQKGEVVLITNDKGHVRSGQYRGFDYGNRDLWIWRGNRIERVLAWMPLPTPWEGGQDD